ADLHGDFTVDGPDDGAYGGFVLGLAGYGAVQVDQVQPAGPLLQPLGGHGCRVLGKDRGVVEVALAQAYALSVLEIDGRDEKHGGRISTEVDRYRFVGGRSDQGFQPTKLRYSRRPVSPLFSGWNWTAKILACATAQVKLTP